MHDKESPNRGAQIDRIAWLVTFVVPLVLALGLLTVKSAQATQPVPPTVSFADEEELEAEAADEGEAGLGAADVCIEAEDALEAGELPEIEVEEICEEIEAEKETSGAASSECPLRSANAHATTKHDKLKLTVGYTTYEPGRATVQIRNGSTARSFKRHLGKSGVLRFALPIDEEHKAKRVVVRIQLSGKAGCYRADEAAVLFK